MTLAVTTFAAFAGATPAHADDWRAAAGFGPWGFHSSGDMDGFAFDLRAHYRNGPFLVGGELVAVNEFKIDILGNDSGPRDGAIELAPTAGFVIGDRIQLDGTVGPAFVAGRHRDGFNAFGVAAGAGVGVVIQRNATRQLLVGVRGATGINRDNTFELVTFGLTVGSCACGGSGG